MSQPDFTVDIYQNEYLPEGGRDVNAVVTVATSGAAAAPAVGPASAVTVAGTTVGPAGLLLLPQPATHPIVMVRHASVPAR